MPGPVTRSEWPAFGVRSRPPPIRLSQLFVHTALLTGREPGSPLACGCMSTDYSSASTTSPPVRISAGTAVKIGFFGALGATLFSLILSLVVGIVIFVLALLGIGIGSLIQLPR